MLADGTVVASGRKVSSGAKLALGAAGRNLIKGSEGYRSHTYQPTLGSGVTIGYGYDMKGRSRAQVRRDLIAVGVPETRADRIAAGARLTGRAARAFANANQGICVLDQDKANALFELDVRNYVDAVHNQVTVPLTQNQFDALVSLVYTIGPGNPMETDPKKQTGFYWSTLRKDLNSGNYAQAARDFSLYVYSGGIRQRGLVARRAAESALFSR